MTLVAENLHTGYYDGFDCVDASVEPTESFKCHVCLLCVVADYPALALMTGFVHEGAKSCHWCMVHGTKNMAIHRFNTGFRQFLPPSHTDRRAGGNFESKDSRPQPKYRTHRETVVSGLLARDWQGYQNANPKLKTGVSNWCPLCVVPLFDVVWDAMGDMMHLCMYYPRHILPVMKGETTIAAPRLLKINVKEGLNDEEKADNALRVSTNEQRIERHAQEKRVHSKLNANFSYLYIYVNHKYNTDHIRGYVCTMYIFHRLWRVLRSRLKNKPPSTRDFHDCTG